MDDLKKKKRLQRASFTRELNVLNQGLEADINAQSLKISFHMLEEKMTQLSATTEKFIDYILEDPETTDEALEREVEEADEYKRKYLSARFNVEQRLNAPTDVVVTHNGTTPQTESRKTYRLPQIELCKFGGDIKEWLQFWSLFKKIHEDSNLSKEDKFQYLIQAMIPNSRAACLVKSYPPTGDNYDKVISGLKNRFGNDSLQIEVYVRELLQLVLKNSITPAKDIQLSTLYDKIESHLRALESLGVTSDKCAAMLFPLVESSLPEELLRAWQRSSAMHASVTQDTENAEIHAEDRLTQLIKFLEAEVHNEVRISMAVKGFDLKSSEQSDNAKNKKSKNRSDDKNIPSATGLLSTKDKIQPCLFCDSTDHQNATCEKAKKMTIVQRREIVKCKHACFNCLKFGHGSRQCTTKLKCEWCSR
ncbi:uncharacterized protein LOC127279596 [Leptopilina boulardi]|uniref:uncharacterized protein LOC127279596 n=1 Tax=Leptopilina boulardi TaxID=63433 RepID=UPI0021F51040|nr:uncharacterized protein LOC127279596 [Leptopilina boulardi]